MGIRRKRRKCDDVWQRHYRRRKDERGDTKRMRSRRRKRRADGCRKML